MKKPFKVFAASAITALLLSACTSNQSSTDEKKKTDDGKGTTTITMVMKDESASNPSSKAYFSQLEKNLKTDENLNVHIKLVDVPQGNYAEKLNLLLTSGQIPDLIYFQGGGETQMAQQNLLEDLTPYIDKSQYIKNILAPYDKERLKNFPYLLWIKPLSQSTPVIRKDWFDKTASGKSLLADPTIDNYYNFFKELKNSPPGGSGKPKFAMTAAGDIQDLNYIFDDAFGITSTWMKDASGKYVYSRVTDNEKNELEFYHKLYKEGLLDPQYITKQWDTKEKAFYDGDAGVIVGTAGKVIDIYDGKMKSVNGDGAGLVVLPPAKGAAQGFGATDVTKESRGIAVSSQSKHKDIAFKILDYLASPKGQMFDRLGFENEDYKVTDGKIDLTDKYFAEWYARFWEPASFTPDQPLVKPLLGDTAQQSLDLVQKYYTEDKSFILPEDQVANWDAMQNLYKEFSTDIITGKKPISAFDDFVKQWEGAGGKDLTKYANDKLK
jgi:putative aldouronate transport system substrate-binding protein